MNSLPTDGSWGKRRWPDSHEHKFKGGYGPLMTSAPPILPIPSTSYYFSTIKGKKVPKTFCVIWQLFTTSCAVKSPSFHIPPLAIRLSVVKSHWSWTVWNKSNGQNDLVLGANLCKINECCHATTASGKSNMWRRAVLLQCWYHAHTSTPRFAQYSWLGDRANIGVVPRPNVNRHYRFDFLPAVVTTCP